MRASRRPAGVASSPAQVTALIEQCADLIKRAPERVRAPLHPADKARILPLQPAIPLGPAGMLVAVRTPMTRMGIEPQRAAARPPHRSAVGSPSSAGPRRNSNPSQRRCQIPPFLRRPVVEVARNADAANRLDGYRKIHHGQPAGPPAFGQYQRAGIVPWRHAWIQDDGEPGTPAGRHLNDVSGSQGLQGRRHGPRLSRDAARASAASRALRAPGATPCTPRKSPRSQLIRVAYSSSDFSLRRIWATRPARRHGRLGTARTMRRAVRGRRTGPFDRPD